MAWRPAGRTLPLRASTAVVLSSGPPVRRSMRVPGTPGSFRAFRAAKTSPSAGRSAKAAPAGRDGARPGRAGAARDAGAGGPGLFQGLQGGEALAVRWAVGKVRAGVQVGDLAGAVDDH